MNLFFDFIFKTTWGRGFLLLIGLFALALWAFSQGVQHERTRNTAIENAKLVQYGQRILALQTKAREDERASVKKVNELTVNYEKRIQDAQTKTKSTLRDVATGARQLRITTKGIMPACGDSTSTTSTIAAATTETSAELSRQAAEFLINITDECDTTAEKLNLAIDIATSDRVSNLPSSQPSPLNGERVQVEVVK